MKTHIALTGDPLQRMKNIGIDPTRVGFLTEGSTSQSTTTTTQSTSTPVQSIVESTQGNPAAQPAQPAAQPVQTTESVTLPQFRTNVRAQLTEARLKEGPRASLVALIESAEQNVDLREDVNTALRLVADNADLLSRRYWDIQQEDVANRLVRMANRADEIAEDASVTESAKHQIVDNFIGVLSEAHQTWITTVTGQQLPNVVMQNEQFDANGRLMRRRGAVGN